MNVHKYIFSGEKWNIGDIQNVKNIEILKFYRLGSILGYVKFLMESIMDREMKTLCYSI